MTEVLATTVSREYLKLITRQRFSGSLLEPGQNAFSGFSFNVEEFKQLRIDEVESAEF